MPGSFLSHWEQSERLAQESVDVRASQGLLACVTSSLLRTGFEVRGFGNLGDGGGEGEGWVEQELG
jgi:hypothetical protein